MKDIQKDPTKALQTENKAPNDSFHDVNSCQNKFMHFKPGKSHKLRQFFP